MNYSFLQLFIFAQNETAEKWINILFVVVLAVVWAFGGIIKAKAEQSRRKKNKQAPRKPSRPSSSVGRDRGEIILDKVLGPASTLSRKRRKVPDSRFSKQKFTAKSLSGTTVPIQKTKQTHGTEFSLPSSSFESGIQELPKIDDQLQELPEFTSQDVKKLKDSHVITSSEMSQSKYLSELLSVYANPDELKRAILHYEILGPPLSLRTLS